MAHITQRIALLGSITAIAIGSLGATALARNGADDPAGHDRGGKVERVHHKRHRHHGLARAARHGADDPAGHDRGDDRGSR